MSVRLTKDEPTATLADRGLTAGTLMVNLNWSRAVPASTGGGFLGRVRAAAREARAAIDGSGGPVDLDLGCLWQATDGSKGVVQALGSRFGSLRGQPYIALDGDDRSGDNTSGETLRINLDQSSWFRRVLVFAYIYSGSPDWGSAAGRVTMGMEGGPVEIDVLVDDADGSGAKFCAVAMLDRDKSGGLQVTRLMRYIHGSQSDLDSAYGWGLSWRAGSK